MSIEDNKEIVRRWVTARNQNDLDLALSVWSRELHERITAGFNGMSNAFSDIHITIDELFGEGDLVALSATLRATHSGPYHNIPATHKQITFATFDIYTVQQGKITSVKRMADELGLLKQLGVSISLQGTPLT